MLYYIHQFILCSIFLISTSCGSQPMNQSGDQEEDISMEDSKNQNLSCAGKVVENTIEPPSFKTVQKTGGVLQVSSKINWEVDKKIKEKYGATFDALESQAKKVGVAQKEPITVEVKVVPVEALKKVENNLPAGFDHRSEAYLLKVDQNRVSVYAVDEAGIVNGLSSLGIFVQKVSGKSGAGKYSGLAGS